MTTTHLTNELEAEALTETVAMAIAAEGALIQVLRGELLDNEIEELLHTVVAELLTTYQTVVSVAGEPIEGDTQQ